MAKSYKNDTYKRHVYKLRPRPQLAILAVLEPTPELDPGAESTDPGLGASLATDDPGLGDQVTHDGPPEVGPTAKPDETAQIGGGATPDDTPTLGGGTDAPTSPSMTGGASAERNASLLEAPQGEKTWLEIELVNSDATPVKNERYLVKLADGSLRNGRLGADGTARLEGLDPGRCTVSFPDRDGDAWTEVEPLKVYLPQVPLTSPKGTWLEIVLLNSDDTPVKNERFLVKLADGSERSGTLGSDGRARLDGLDPGSCIVSFPDLDAEGCEAT